MVQPWHLCILAPCLALAPLRALPPAPAAPPLPAPNALQAQEPSIRLADTMDFGILLSGPQGGMIALTELGVLVPTGPGVQARSGAPAHSARFLLQGKPGTAFTLHLTPSTPFLVGPQGARIPVNSFLCLPASLTGTFNGEGNAEVRLGARLDLRADLPPGTYTAPLWLQLQAQGNHGPSTILQAFQVKTRLQGSFKLTCVAGLDFGTLIPGSSQGQFEVKAAGGYRAVSPGGPTLFKGAPQPAVFLLEGQPGAEYSLQVPAQITLTGPGQPITVRDFTLDTPCNGILLQSGKRFGLGGRMVIPPNQENGRYRGVLQVTVAYP